MPPRVAFDSQPAVHSFTPLSEPGCDTSTLPTFDTNDLDESVEASQVIMAVHEIRGRTAVVQLDSNSGTLLISEDAQDGPHRDLLVSILEQYKPSLVLISTKAELSLSEKVQQTLSGWSATATVETRPAKEFSVETGRAALLELDLPKHAPASPDVSSSEESDQSGLSHISSARPRVASSKISSIELMPLSSVLQISTHSLVALQVFASGSHAAGRNDASTAKMPNLFDVINTTRSAAGRTTLRQWIIRPSLDTHVIQARQTAIACFLRPENLHIMYDLRSCLKVQQAASVLEKLRCGQGNATPTWRAITTMLSSALQVREQLLGLTHLQTSALLFQIANSVNVELFEALLITIEDRIDWHESGFQGKLCIQNGVNAQLDQYRQQYASLPNDLSHVARHLSVQISPDVCDALNVVYFPQLGYLCSLTLKAGQDPKQLDLPGWTYQFSTECFSYWKTSEMQDLDEQYGDLASMISDLEIDIVEELTAQVMSAETILHDATHLLGQLDALVCLADAAKRLAWSRPVITSDNVLRIRQGRHAVLETLLDRYIGNDTSLVAGNGLHTGEDESSETSDSRMDVDRSVMILTGSNFSGKSVYVKAVALIVLLAHVGSYIPADNAIIGLTDRILTRVQTRESATNPASLFVSDLQQVSYMLRNATPRSLLLADEFGKGTETNDGISLFCGLVEHLCQRGTDCPRTILTTHYASAFQTNMLQLERRGVLLAQMAITFAGAMPDDDEDAEIVYLYQLAKGVATESHALACAAQFGLPSHLIARAREVSAALLDFSLTELCRPKPDEAEIRRLSHAQRVADIFLGLELDNDGDITRGSYREMLELVLSSSIRGDGDPQGSLGALTLPSDEILAFEE
ncbi:hypothetical protein E5Q_01019 [Mixia osmundae IAM 14324]|uniref:DNA mismatch repair proteins mutS family domain-containing protein n=1 Tax=Mixia osmundae (strain CBS 9802 / IAM 14324 / JCM 22182 / KY 12970) TaxID=764103 RepID=G7DUV8_MIXOS|nr:hypothetical protein E5Q_01019 [Mixia osmundae IAM 14324]